MLLYRNTKKIYFTSNVILTTYLVYGSQLAQIMTCPRAPSKKIYNWGSLTWVIENPSDNTIFIDLNIRIHNNDITTSTFQKPMNLYLYIPPQSGHPPSCFNGLITGEMRHYWLQNSPEQFQHIMSNFIDRLLQRGHTMSNLTLTPLKVSSNKKQSTDTLYLHWPYHPNGLQRQQPFINYDSMQVAISWPKNLDDTLTRTALIMSDNDIIKNTINECIQTQSDKRNLCRNL